jgi:thymidine kinase
MAKMYFRYSTMNAGKSAQVLIAYHNYKEQGKDALLLTSSIDDRYGVGKVTSRIGLQEDAIIVNNDTNVLELVKDLLQKHNYDAVIVDEGQFLKRHHVEQLTDVVHELHIPVIVYGLKNDAFNELFEGSQYLLIYAEKIEEMKTVCWFCRSKATRNLRISQENKPVFSGPQIKVGGNDSHLPTCLKCYKVMQKTGELLQIKTRKQETDDEDSE